MEIINSKIPGLAIIKPRVFEDSRGYFFESFNNNQFIENNINLNFIQDNESKSQYGVIRGLHYQLSPYAQTKLVRVIQGKVFDVAVDIRKGSPTFGQWEGVELSAENKLQFLVPKGFAHGFVVLSETAIFSYKCDEFYNPQNERGIRFDDPYLNIDWKLNPKDSIVSDKDLILPAFSEAENNFSF